MKFVLINQKGHIAHNRLGMVISELPKEHEEPGNSFELYVIKIKNVHQSITMPKHLVIELDSEAFQSKIDSDGFEYAVENYGGEFHSLPEYNKLLNEYLNAKSNLMYFMQDELHLTPPF